MFSFHCLFLWEKTWMFIRFYIERYLEQSFWTLPSFKSSTRDPYFFNKSSTGLKNPFKPGPYKPDYVYPLYATLPGIYRVLINSFNYVHPRTWHVLFRFDRFSGQRVKDAVLTVPPFFGQAERRAVMDAAALAEVNVLQVSSHITCFLKRTWM